MSVRINLLPDIRLAKIRARHIRQLAFGIATLTSGLAIGIVVVLVIITTAQQLQIAGLNKSIHDKQSELAGKSDLQEIATLQQHLNSLPTLYSDRPSIVAFFAAVQKVTPTELSLNKVDFTQLATIQATGNARSMATVDKLVKAMQASKAPDGSNYFSNELVTTENQDAISGITFDLAVDVAQEATHAK
jgi:hypothetical protein